MSSILKNCRKVCIFHLKQSKTCLEIKSVLPVVWLGENVYTSDLTKMT